MGRIPVLLAMFLGVLLPGSACIGAPQGVDRPAAAGVGYRVFTRADSSRGLRPVQVSVWYPAAVSPAAARMTLGDYARTIAVEGTALPVTPELATTGQRELEAYLVSLGATQDAAHEALGMQLGAVAQSPRPGSPLPTVVLALGKDESPVLHADLAERLAGSGFVVVTVPTVGTNRRATSWAAEDIATHAADLAFALRVLARDRWSDTTRLAALGYSYGSGAAVLVARRAAGVRALAILDGSLAFRDRLPTFETALAGVTVTVPVIHVSARNDARLSFALMERVAPQARLTISDSTGHLDFTTLALVATRPGFDGFMRLGDQLLPPGVAYSRVASHVIAFLTRHLEP